ncbi:hypothetical protein [Actinomyces faecalis]|uniref:hypothetical protein n=1 Tax=Actinomyces faecalis TaxID=2722820 RepID=UPI0015523D52|nr:hypothetical protein [Actinomyces faecalis]
MRQSTIVIDVPGNEWLSANGREHRFDRARRTATLRKRACLLARHHGLPHYTGRVRVDFYVHTRTHNRMDPANAYPTVKALVDGLTDAGVWADDDDTHLSGPVPHRGEHAPDLPVGFRRVTLTVTDLDEEA